MLLRPIAEQPGAQHEHAQRHRPQHIPAHAPSVGAVPGQDDRDERAGDHQPQTRSAHGGARGHAPPPRAEPGRYQPHRRHVSAGAAHPRQKTAHPGALEAGQEPGQHHPQRRHEQRHGDHHARAVPRSQEAGEHRREHVTDQVPRLQFARLGVGQREAVLHRRQDAGVAEPRQTQRAENGQHDQRQHHEPVVQAGAGHSTCGGPPVRRRAPGVRGNRIVICPPTAAQAFR